MLAAVTPGKTTNSRAVCSVEITPGRAEVDLDVSYLKRTDIVAPPAVTGKVATVDDSHPSPQFPRAIRLFPHIDLDKPMPYDLAPAERIPMERRRATLCEMRASQLLC